MEEYVTCRLLDAKLGKTEALMERNLARQDAHQTDIANNIKGEIIELRTEVKTLSTKIDVIDAKLNLLLGELSKRIRLY